MDFFVLKKFMDWHKFILYAFGTHARKILCIYFVSFKLQFGPSPGTEKGRFFQTHKLQSIWIEVSSLQLERKLMIGKQLATKLNFYTP